MYYKKANNIAILQPTRWGEILTKAVEIGKEKGLSEEFVAAFLKAIHHESIKHQEEVLKDKVTSK